MIPSAHPRIAGSLHELFAGYNGPPFAVRLWDGSFWSSAQEPPVCTLVLASPAVLAMLMTTSSQIELGEAFIEGSLAIEGDLLSAFAIGEHILRRPATLRAKLLTRAAQSALAIRHGLALGLRHSPARDRAAIAWHYDQPVDFFRLFLGPTLVYSCAYFESPSDSLDDAQIRKIDYICRKLRLRSGERFLDIGCGWGSLVLHAACRYAAQVTGITLSHEQEKTVRGRILESDPGARCEVRFQDYRRLDSQREQYDKIASVGMAEHVGLGNLPLYFRLIHGILRPGGVFLNHAIARSATGAAPRGHDSFIARYVFPDGHLVTLNQMLGAAESAGFEVRDVENLREHYERTLRCWVEALCRNRAAVLQLVSETTYRIWLLYMAGCADAFRRGDIAVFQTVLSRPDHGRSRLPLTRDDWYLPGGRKRLAATQNRLN